MIDIDHAIAVLQAHKAGKTILYTRSWGNSHHWKPVKKDHHFDFTNNVYDVHEQRSPRPAPASHYERIKPRVRILPYGYIQNDAGKVFS